MVPEGYTIMSAMSDSKNTTAKIMVMRSRFFSTMLVPVCDEYTELAIMSEMPVPLPECSRMKMMRPKPEITSKAMRMIKRGLTYCHFHSKLRMQVLKYIEKSLREQEPLAGENKRNTRHYKQLRTYEMLCKQTATRHSHRSSKAHHVKQRRRNVAQRPFASA